MSRILVVEDDEGLLEALSAGLSFHGHRVATATTAEAAHALLRSEKFRLVISDVMLPGGGYSVLARARQLQPEAPVIMITGQEEEHGRARALDAGAFAYVVKPITLGELSSLTERALNGA